MAEDRKRFQLIDGFRSSPNRAMPARPVHAPFLPRGGEDALHNHPTATEGGELTIALKATEQRLSTLLEDRNRIGRDLHDCVLQSLYAIGLNLETSRRANPHETADAERSSKRVVEQINQLIHEIRRMIRGLEGGTIREFDLASELLTLSATYEQVGRLQITLDLQPGAIEVLTSEEEQEILNIVREGLSNCARHASATQATVSIRMRRSRIRVSISDDGIGFIAKPGQPQGYGLANMVARARKLGGTLRVQSRIGRGTHIIAEFSLEPILSPV
ncbi:MAG TPA: histidine kinase [Nitrospiraceae bacterium]|nr:histidine kinase [Nitrospiraceae bacterium]